MTRPPLALVVATLAAVVLAGCGSTVATTAGSVAPAHDPALGSGLAAPQGELGGAAGAPGATGPDPGAGAAAALSDPGAVAASAAATGTDRSGVGTASGGVQPPRPEARASAPAAPPGAAPGVTPTTIRFGAAYSTDTGEANRALGAENLDPGDARRYYDAIVREVNASGGVAGRKLVPSYFEARATSAESADSQTQAACEKWTKDDPVFVIFGATSEIARSCAEKAGMVALSSSATNSVRATFERYPHYIEVSSISLDRAARATVEGLAKTDYFGGKPVIGIVAWDDPNYRAAVEQALIPALKQRGFTPETPAYVKVAESNAGLGDSSAGASNAVLRFRSAGVTHVLIVDGPAGVFIGTGLTVLFIRAAGSQSYYPRYGFNDSNNPEAGRQAGLWSADDVRGSRAVTWNNVLDESDDGARPNMRRKACLDVMRRAGISVTNVNARSTALRACDWVWFLRATLGAAPAPVSRAAVVQAAGGLGTAYQSPLVYGTRFTPTQRDGVGKLRLMKLDDGCGCFTYISPPYPAP